MHNLKNNEKYKLNFSELKLILIQMGFFNDLNRKKIGFNPHPFSRQKKKKEHDIDLHLEVTRKLDEVIARNKESEQTDNKDITIPKFIEIREPSFRSPGMPAFQSDLSPKGSFQELEGIQEFVEIEPPTNFLMQKEPEFDSWMINQGEKDQKTYWGFGHIKIRTKGTEPTKNSTNNSTNKNIETTIAKIELEETKKDIERKKKELEDALKKEREKALLVKKEQGERRKQEKQKKIELKKQLKEEKIKEKLEKKAQKEHEKASKEQEIQLKKQELIKGKAPEEKTFQEEKIQPELTDIVEERKEYIQDNLSENLNLDEDVAKLLPIIDSLFEKLPEEAIDEFTRSEYFELYEKVLLKYKNK